eukprot:gnl/MRDRNA2_/MRDRNA2_374850_c0_seq1.p1 gnl/MRDRNA2_/MRDRNA2_374850_c0~~gnl/MRDRNA2_/MRDRNA2_374850_c0_seq1.p1  ORF type:complete len:143 (+),score=6.12 gnl/MRDRNA2_/MRDRNA2_374850_c0_seq1:32-430(+)
METVFIMWLDRHRSAPLNPFRFHEKDDDASLKGERNDRAKYIDLAFRHLFPLVVLITFLWLFLTTQLQVTFYVDLSFICLNLFVVLCQIFFVASTILFILRRYRHVTRSMDFEQMTPRSGSDSESDGKHWFS